MRSAILSLFLLFLCGFIKLGLSDSANVEVEPVLDMDRHAVVASAEYYLLLHLPHPDGGGFRPGNTSNTTTCPLGIIQDPNPSSLGNPLKLSSSPLAEKGIISTNEVVEISFSDKVKCVESLKWMVVKEKGEDFWSLAVGSAHDHPGADVLRGSFTIQKHRGGGYKVLFCRDGGVCGNMLFHDAKTFFRLILDFDGDSAINFEFHPKA